jgi:hypothetical protein
MGEIVQLGSEFARQNYISQRKTAQCRAVLDLAGEPISFRVDFSDTAPSCIDVSDSVPTTSQMLARRSIAAHRPRVRCPSAAAARKCAGRVLGDRKLELRSNQE